jgi:hypothetical protein
MIECGGEVTAFYPSPENLNFDEGKNLELAGRVGT